MIGLEYILALYNVPHTELAKELGIARQNINLWIKGKGKIPEKHLPKLSEKFQIPEEYFQKELTKEDELKIQRIKVENEWEIVLKQLTENNTINEEARKRAGELLSLHGRLTHDETKIRLKKILEIKDDNRLLYECKYRLLNLVADVIEDKNVKEISKASGFLNLLLHYYNPSERKYSIPQNDKEYESILEELVDTFDEIKKCVFRELSNDKDNNPKQ